jgi:anti-sigma regulatory factor (Ser/Thr protein kinase)
MTRTSSRKRAVAAETVVLADGEGVAQAAAFAKGYAADCGLEEATAARLAVIVDELLTNLVKYGHPAGAPAARAVLRLRLEESRLTVEMIDDGEPFDPLSAPPPDLEVAPERRGVGGLGLHLVRSLAETLRYERIEGRNHLTLTLRARVEAR